MPAWFDLESLDNLEQETDIEGLKKSAKTVYGLIEDEIRSGIPSNKIIIGGFSQGGNEKSKVFNSLKLRE